jgi:polysaccharide deacetylase 2 family uncharacterized protein YibQ
LEEKKSTIGVLMVLLALSSLGFAVLGLLGGPELPFDLGAEHRVELEIARPKAPDLDSLADFWQDSGYIILRRHQDYHVQVGAASQDLAWVQGQETLVLVPERHELRLSRAVLQLAELFLAEGWKIQLESSEHGYTLGFWSSVSEMDSQVLAYEWKIELLNPQNYDYYYGGFISVLGERFDPGGFLRKTPQSPVLAVIIDDWGYSTPAVEPLIAYPLPLTMAVLPHLELSQEASERLVRAGHEVILHQPMEALSSTLDLGPGGVTLGMDGEEVEARLKENLASLPVVVGLNNHMGSLVTADPEIMAHVLKVVKELGLFFVDSRTTTASVVREVALELGVSIGVSNFFIDNESDVDKIKGQLRAGLELAQRQGHAVVIGHVRPATADALWQMIPEFLDSDVQFVPISRVLVGE